VTTAAARPPDQAARQRLAESPDHPDALATLVGFYYARGQNPHLVPALARALVTAPSMLDPLWIDTVAATRGLPMGINETAARTLGYPSKPPRNLILLNGFHRVPTQPLEIALMRLLGLRRGGLHVHGELRTTTFDPIQARRELVDGRLVRAHVPASLRLRACLNMLQIRPIILVRNIFETIASYVGGGYFITDGHRFADLGEERQRRLLLLRNASDLVDLFASWSVLAAANPRLLRVDRYEDVSRDWPGYVLRVLEERGVRVTRERVEAAMVGLPPEPGFGRSHFTDAEKALVRELYVQYPTVDFRAIDPELS